MGAARSGRRRRLSRASSRRPCPPPHPQPAGRGDPGQGRGRPSGCAAGAPARRGGHRATPTASVTPAGYGCGCGLSICLRGRGCACLGAAVGRCGLSAGRTAAGGAPRPGPRRMPAIRSSVKLLRVIPVLSRWAGLHHAPGNNKGQVTTSSASLREAAPPAVGSGSLSSPYRAMQHESCQWPFRFRILVQRPAHKDSFSRRLHHRSRSSNAPPSRRW